MVNMTNLYIPICGFFCALLLIVTFFSKKRVKNIETKLFSGMLITSFIDTLMMICIILLAYLSRESYVLLKVLNKIDYIQFMLWIWILFLYIYYVIHKDNIKIDTKIDNLIKKSGIFNALIIILMILLPVKLYNENNIMYSYGPSCNVMYFFCAIYLFIIFIFMILNYKKVLNKKFIPFYVFLLLASIVLVVKNINPGLVIVTAVLAYINLIMYFTIENPDVKLVGKLVDNKKMVESAFEDKSIYLFKLTQEVREPVEKINELVKKYKDSNKKDKKIILEKIKKYSHDLNFVINDVIDISNVDVNNIKLYNKTYNTQNFFYDIKKNTELTIKDNQNINLYFDINRTLPDELYGNPVKLKQVMMILIENAIKYTDKGIIDINIDGITRYNTCRLVITIKDTGRGMNLKEINKIVLSNNDLTLDEIDKLDNVDVDLIKSLKIIKLLGGNVNIKSELDTGTELTIVLDQKVNFSEENKFLQNVSSKIGTIKILIVDNDNSEINKIIRILSKKDISTSVAMYGQECIDKIRSGEKYNLIIIDDEMKPDNALPTLQKLKELKKFNVPVIVMLEKEKDFIKHHYVKDGFTDYILKDNLNKEINRIIDKYL